MTVDMEVPSKYLLEWVENAAPEIYGSMVKLFDALGSGRQPLKVAAARQFFHYYLARNCPRKIFLGKTADGDLEATFYGPDDERDQVTMKFDGSPKVAISYAHGNRCGCNEFAVEALMNYACMASVLAPWS